MRALHFDLSFGCSGDMLLGALIDLGVSFEAVHEPLARLLPEGKGIFCRPVLRGGIRALQFVVPEVEAAEIPEQAVRPVHGHPPHDHASHDHGPGHPHPTLPAAPAHGRHPSHRRYGAICRMLEASRLSAPALARSLRIFSLLAEAEGKVHGVPPEEVHFHEVGAADSIIDIVGVSLALEQLGVDRFTCSPADVGSGTVRCAHGLLPVPAPATTELLKGFPVYAGPFRQEMVTPTGAAVLRALVDEPGRMPPGRVLGVGQGAGSRELAGGANVLRVFLMELEDEPASPFDAEVDVLECNLDDMSPELIGDLASRLPSEGALDVCISPVYMKKFRPGSLLTVICRPESTAVLTETLFRSTSTFGVRCHRCRRAELEREFVEVETPSGPVTVKVGKRHGLRLSFSPEYESCRQAAERSGRPLMEIYHQAEDAARRTP